MTTLSPVDSDTADQHRDDLSFQVDGETVRAWHYPGRGERFAGPDGRPVVVMAHGLGATKDSALPGFAERLSAAAWTSCCSTTATSATAMALCAR